VIQYFLNIRTLYLVDHWELLIKLIVARTVSLEQPLYALAVRSDYENHVFPVKLKETFEKHVC
jgi:hypothetical protein